jgi:non-ribosomal peptide synthetase component F
VKIKKGTSKITMGSIFETRYQNASATSDAAASPTWKNGTIEEWKMCIHQAIQHRVISQPHAQAICSEEGNLSYCELDQVANCLARYLVDLGVGPEVIVPLCFDKSMWNIISMLGVLKVS